MISGPLDLASHSRAAAPPAWLRGRLERALDRLAAHPDPTSAVRTVARRHERDAAEVLLTTGGSDALALLARVLQPRHAVVVHPALTGAERALAAAGHQVHRLVLAPPFDLDPALLPDEADLVVVGNPGDPTGVVHAGLDGLCRPGRTVVVDESLMEGVPGEPDSLAGRADLPGLVVVRSLSSTWSLAGLRVGYLLAPPDLVERLAAVQSPWPVGTLGLVALETCLARGPIRTAERDADLLAQERERLSGALQELGVQVARGTAPYLLCRVADRPELAAELLGEGVVVQPCDQVPGLQAGHWRAAVRGAAESERLLEVLSGVLATTPAARRPSSA